MNVNCGTIIEGDPLQTRAMINWMAIEPAPRLGNSWGFGGVWGLHH